MARVRVSAVLTLAAGVVVFAAAARQSPRPLDGIWLSDGYGLMAEIGGDEMRLFEVTPISCIGSGVATRQRSAAGHPVFRMSGGPLLTLLPGASAGERRIHPPGAASDIVIRRVPAKPAACARETPDTPESNFDVFWTTFNAHHAFLRERGVDWAATRAKYRPQVTAATTPGDLFSVLSAMIEPLHDAHTSLRASTLVRTFHGGRAGWAPIGQDTAGQAFEIIRTKYLQGAPRSFCSGNVLYGRTRNNGAGYLRIAAFAGYAGGGFEAEARALAEALDAIVEDLRGLKTLVIDVRVNGGGADPLGVMVASRLTDRRYVAFVKRARNDPEDPTRFTAPQTTWVEPAPGARFTGQVVELTSRDSISAAETFSMALMGRTPRVVRIGEPTQGVYSDVLGRRLPNGWRFGLPNEVFLTEGGKHFEVVGVPPDVAVPVFPREDLRAGRDSALDKALELAVRGDKSK
ncbi:MAG: S41 family peptidase [Bacteroidales bacterium]